MTNASLTATRAVLMQADFNGDLHSCIFLFKTLSATECNYDIFDQELLAVIHALTEWKHYCYSFSFFSFLFLWTYYFSLYIWI